MLGKNSTKRGENFASFLFPVFLIAGFFIFGINAHAGENILYQDNFNTGQASDWQEQVDSGASWLVEDGKYRLIESGRSIVAKTIYQQGFSWKDYSFSFDVDLNDGVDRNVFFRMQDYQNHYSLGLKGFWWASSDTPVIYLLRCYQGQCEVVNHNGYVAAYHFSDPGALNNETAHFDIETVGNKTKIFYNNSLIIDWQEPNDNYPKSGTIGFLGWSGDYGATDFASYNLKVKSLSDEPVKRNPVIIVPGIIASYLNNAGNNEEIWPNIGKMKGPGDGYLDDLILEENGSLDINNPNINPTDIFRSIGEYDFFAGLIHELENNGYKEGVDLFVFPYDWRIDLNILAGDDDLWPGIYTLKEKITDVKLATKAEKVNVIAHSMGGLVVKTYLEKNGHINIDKFIDIATPHLGSPSAFKILNYGDNLGFCQDIFNKNICILSDKKVKSISQNFPSVYQLLPSRAYFDIKDFNIPDKDYENYAIDIDDIDGNGVRGGLNYNQTAEFLTNQGRNNILLNITKVNESLHNKIDDLYFRNSFNIVGAGVPTIGKVYILNKEKNGKYEYGLKYINGDGTVPFRSGESFSDNLIYASGTHAYLPSADGVRQAVVSILKGSIQNFDFSQFENLSLDRNKFKINATQISYHSPIELHIYDEFGNHVGPTANGDIEIGIPGVKYDVIEDNKFAVLPMGGKYTITGQAIAIGTFNARIENIENGEYTKKVYFNELPLISTSTKTEFRIEDNQTEYAIKIDNNGDNIFEEEVAPSSILINKELSDLIKPVTEISVSGTAGDNNYYSSDVVIILNFSDENSGVLKTEYSVDSGSTWIKYINPVVISEEKENKIIYSSTDRAGNRENDKELIIKIDKTAPEILILTPEKISRNKILDIQYLTSDNFSGLATDTVKIYFDGQTTNNQSVDLFYKKLGEYEIKIIAQDKAGNQAEVKTKIEIMIDIIGVIADISRGYEEKTLNLKAKDDLIKDLRNIQKYIEKYGQKEVLKNKKEQELMAKCIEKKGSVWCEKKIGGIFNKIDYRFSEIHKKLLKIQYNLVLKKLELFRKLDWVKQGGYDIIKEDLEYLINKI